MHLRSQEIIFFYFSVHKHRQLEAAHIYLGILYFYLLDLVVKDWVLSSDTRLLLGDH